MKVLIANNELECTLPQDATASLESLQQYLVQQFQLPTSEFDIVLRGQIQTHTTAISNKSTIRLKSKHDYFNAPPIAKAAPKFVQNFSIAIPPTPVLVHADYIFQGPQTSVSYKQGALLLPMQITHVINLCEQVQYTVQAPLQIFHVPMHDHESQPLQAPIQSVVQFITETKSKQENAKFVIHCLAGVSRSVAVTIGVLMNLAPSKNLQATLEHVRECRKNIGNTNPNSGFMYELQKMYK